MECLDVEFGPPPTPEALGVFEFLRPPATEDAVEGVDCWVTDPFTFPVEEESVGYSPTGARGLFPGAPAPDPGPENSEEKAFVIEGVSDPVLPRFPR